MDDVIRGELDKEIQDITRISILEDELSQEYRRLLEEGKTKKKSRYEMLAESAKKTGEITQVLEEYASRVKSYKEELGRLEWTKDYLLFAKLVLSKNVNGKNVDEVFSLLGSLRERWDRFEVMNDDTSTSSSSDFEEISLFSRFFDETRVLCQHLRENSEKALLESVSTENWPLENVAPSDEFLERVHVLCKLQMGFMRSGTLYSVVEDESFTLWFVQVLLKPIMVRFEYHFKSEKETARVDKPEYMFKYLGRLIDMIAYQSRIFFQPIVERVFKGEQGRICFQGSAVSSSRDLILGIHELGRKWVNRVKRADIPGPVRYHLVSESFKFDDRMESNGYAFLDRSKVCFEFTETRDDVEDWVKVELEFVKSKLHDIFKMWYSDDETRDGGGLEPLYIRRLLALSQIVVNRLHKMTREVEIVPSTSFRDVNEYYVGTVLVPIYKQLGAEFSKEYQGTITPREPHTKLYCYSLNAINFLLAHLAEISKHPAVLHSHILLEPVERELSHLSEKMATYLVEYFANEFVDLWRGWIEIPTPSVSAETDPVINAILNKIGSILSKLQDYLRPDLFRRCWAELALTLDKRIFKSLSTEYVKEQDIYVAKDVISRIWLLWGQHIEKPEVLFRKCYEGLSILTLGRRELDGLAKAVRSEANANDGFGKGIFRLTKVEILALFRIRN